MVKAALLLMKVTTQVTLSKERSMGSEYSHGQTEQSTKAAMSMITVPAREFTSRPWVRC